MNRVDDRLLQAHTKATHRLSDRLHGLDTCGPGEKGRTVIDVRGTYLDPRRGFIVEDILHLVKRLLRVCGALYGIPSLHPPLHLLYKMTTDPARPERPRREDLCSPITVAIFYPERWLSGSLSDAVRIVYLDDWQHTNRVLWRLVPVEQGDDDDGELLYMWTLYKNGWSVRLRWLPSGALVLKSENDVPGADNPDRAFKPWCEFWADAAHNVTELRTWWDNSALSWQRLHGMWKRWAQEVDQRDPVSLWRPFDRDILKPCFIGAFVKLTT